MSYHQEKKEKILDEILDHRTLSDPSSIYQNNIESLKELTDSESITSIFSDIENINPSYEKLHTEIINDPYHQLRIREYFKEQGLYIKPIPELIKDNNIDLVGEMFFIDFCKIFEIKRQEYVKNNYLYNKHLSQPHILEGDEDPGEQYFFLSCYYPIDNNTEFKIYVRYTYATNSFRLFLDFNHPDTDFYDQSIKDNSFEKFFIEQFKQHFALTKINTEFPLTKDNIQLCSDMIFKEINKNELTNEDVFQVIKEQNKNSDDLMSDFLNRNLTDKKIEQSFYPILQTTGKRIPEHKSEDNRATYNFEVMFIQVLMNDLKTLLPYFTYNSKLNKLQLSLDNYIFADVQYSLEIRDNKLTLSSDDFFVCSWMINNDIAFKEDISQYIDADIHRYFKTKEKTKDSIEKRLEHELAIFLEHKEVSVNIPHLSTLSLNSILNKNLPVHIQSKTEDIHTNIDFSKDFNENEELLAIKEKIMISGILDTKKHTYSGKINRL